MILQGDCLELLKTLPDASVDMVLCDPPYGTTACKWDSVIPFEPMWKELKRVTKEKSAICLFGSEPFSSHLRMSNLKLYRYDWIWEKDKAANFASAKKQPLKKHEIISVFYQALPTYDWRGEALKKPLTRVMPLNCGEALSLAYTNLNDDGSRKTTTYTHRSKCSTLYFPRENQVSKSLHPTQKPVALLEYLIKTYTLEGETVLDFTMGSGSTGVAAKNTNRKFIGFELDEKYFAIAKQRIESAGQTEVGCA